MPNPVPGVLYQQFGADQAWYARGRESLNVPIVTPPVDPPPVDPPVDPPVEPPVTTGVYSETNLPTRLATGTSVWDGFTSGIAKVNASDILVGDDIGLIAHTADNRSSLPRYLVIVLDKDQTYWLKNFRNYGTTANPDFRGFSNTQRRVLGFVDPTNGKRPIRISPTAITDTPGARELVLDPKYVVNATTGAYNYTSPVAVRAFYLSDSDAPAVGANNVPPMFSSGIRRLGEIQTPLSVYSDRVQGKMARNKTAPSPLAWGGDAYWAAKPGSRIQYCSWEGWGFSINSAPPFEMGMVDTNRSLELTFEHCNWDGRLAAEVDPKRRRVGGGMMWNKDTRITVRNSWLHHTRRSGFAMNTNTNNSAERYEAYNFQIDSVANVGDDGWISDIGTLPGQFGGSNVESLVGQFFYTDVAFNDIVQLGKINVAIARVMDTGTTAVLPERPLIIARNVTTDDPLYGRLVRVNVSKQPNSTGISPAWERVNARGIAGSGLFDFRNKAGQAMTGIRVSEYNASVHKPDTHFIVSY